MRRLPIATKEHTRLAALVGAWAPLRLPTRGALIPLVPEPVWTAALAAALDGPYPAGREAAALLALGTDRLAELGDRLRNRLDPASPPSRAVLATLATHTEREK